MKKRLLITSIVMMLVVAVALSTATYAWFTSNASVTASTVSLTAATNNAAALGIGWTGSAAGTVIETNRAGTLNPMAPAALVPGTTLSNVEFKTATTKVEGDTSKFSAVSSDSALVFDNGGSPSLVDTFYVSNLSGTNKIEQITLTATIDVPQSATTGVDLVRIAVFKKNASNDYVLVGVMATATNATTVYGTPAVGKNSTAVAAASVNADNPMGIFTNTKTSLALGGLGVSASHELKVLMWMDGQALDDSKQGVAATVAFTFTAGTSGQNVTPAGDQVAIDAAAAAQNP